jgi:predicted small secreted protein
MYAAYTWTLEAKAKELSHNRRSLKMIGSKHAFKTYLVSSLLLCLLLLAACQQTDGLGSNIQLADIESNLLEGVTGWTLESSEDSLTTQALSTQALSSAALVYADRFAGNNYVTPALTAQGYNVTIASSWGDFDTKLASGNYGLAVALVQNNFPSPSILTLQAHINAGGRAVYTDWTRTSSYATLFEATYTSNNNRNQASFQSPLNTGIPTPLTLANPGWGT